MTASYPSSVKSFTTKSDLTDLYSASHINDLQAEVVAIETELGTLPKGSYGSVKLRLDGADTGWISPGETWTYNNATSVVLYGVGDIREKYPIGCKIKFVQTTIKYFYLIGATMSGADLILTLSGGSDYTVANAEITSNYLSYASTPQGFPQWFNYVPSLNTDDADLSGYDLAKFAIVGRLCTIEFIANNRNITGSAGSIKIGLPVTTSLAVTNSHQFTVAMFNGSIYAAVRNELANGSAVVKLYKDFSSASFAASETGYYFRISGSYPI